MIETKEMGELFKKIRLSKKLSLKDVAGDFLSVSFLSKFERGESEMSASRLFLLLENLDVSIEEFYGILSKSQQTESEGLIERVGNAYNSNNLTALKRYLNEESQKYEDSGKKTYLYNAIMIKSFIVNLTGEAIDPESINEVTDYLFAIDQWGKRELIILGNSMVAIPTETLHVLIKEIIYKTILFGNTDDNKKTRIHLLINAISVFLDREQLDLAKAYLDMLSEMRIPERFLYERFERDMVLGAYWIKIGQVDIGKKKIELALDSIRHLGADNLLKIREADYNMMLDSII